MPPRKPLQKRKSKWDADNILTDPKSPLAEADLRSILSHPLAWSSLSIDERREVLALFPDASLILDADTEDARPDLQTLMNDDAFRADCAAFVENLAQGRHDAQWLRDAWTAHERRKAGDFDEYLIKKFEEDWGPLPEDMKLEARTKPDGHESTSSSTDLPVIHQDEAQHGNGSGEVDSAALVSKTEEGQNTHTPQEAAETG